MADIFSTTFDGVALAGDWSDSGDDRTTAILNSLFSDRRADEDDELPVDEGEDRRGFWADSDWGSKLWLLDRAKETQETINKAREWAEESLAWLVDDGLALTVDVHAEATRPGLLGLRVRVVWSNETETDLNWEYLWREQAWRSTATS